MPAKENSLMQDDDERGNKEKSLKWKFAFVLPALFFLFVGAFTNNFLINEWTQNKLQNEHFPNMSKTSSFDACNDTNHSDPTYINYKSVQHDTALWVMYFSLAQHVPNILVNMILIGYTDTYGRTFLFILAACGLCIKYCVITIIIHFNASLLYVTAMYGVDGCMGSNYALFAVSFSYVADITDTNNHRVLAVVVVEGTLVFASIVSSLLSGYFIQTLGYGFFKTAVISSSSCFLGFSIIVLLLPESLNKDRRRPSVPLLATIRNMFQFYISKEFKGKRLSYILLILSFFFAEIAVLNRTTIETLYFLGQPFCWGPSKIGVFTTTRYAALGIIGLGSVNIFQLCMSNEAIAVLSTVSNIASFTVEAFATTNLMIYMVPVTGVLSFVMVPLIRGMMSAMTDPDKQGAMFSSIATIDVLSSIAASFSENEIYAVTYSLMNGFVFLIMAGFCVIDCILLTAYYVLRKMKANGSVSPMYEVRDDTR